MNEQAHSPLPWKSNDRRREGKRLQISMTDNKVGYPPQVCAMWNHHTAVANAELIVRACNAHYSIVEALENLLEDYEGQRDGWTLEAQEWTQDIVDKARAALALAKGDTQ